MEADVRTDAEAAVARWTEHLKSHVASAINLYTRVALECGPSTCAAVDLISSALRRDGKLMICGNGGSAADSQHVAAEMTSRLTKDFVRPAIAAMALTTDTSFLTAYSNDMGFDGVFERQVQALGRSGDVLLAISTSGSSENVRRAVQAARTLQIETVALIGQGGQLLREADCAIVIPSTVTAHVQEAMLAVEHVICHAVEREMFSSPA
jgi:D-sedoheptulose 7-phosphate isomerase